MEIIQAIILGLVQGLTEFLPISSSGHLLLLEKIGVGSPSVFFNLALHAGTLFSAVVFYRKRIYKIIKNPLGRESLYLVAATAATGVLAILAEKFLGAVLEGKYLAAGFMTTAVLLFSVEAFRRDKTAGNGTRKSANGDITLKSAVICGLCQGIAVVPGLSRSGATIAALLFAGADREKAANFSFMLSMPVIAAGFILEAVKNRALALSGSQIFPLAVGMATAAIGGFFAIKGFVRFLKKGNMKGFAYYAAALAILCGAVFGVV